MRKQSRSSVLALGLLYCLPPTAGLAATYDLSIGEITANFTGRERPAIAVNGSIPAPTLRFREGEDVVINVTNTLDRASSIHWHGFILPYQMDGVPGLSFPGIGPGETFTYRFKVVQNGTYWYHSHSGLQEQAGLYGAIIVEPKEKDPVAFDREHVVMLSDWTDERPETVLANLKKQSDYYNYNKRTVFDFVSDIDGKGWNSAADDRLMWGQMRMDPTDIADVTGYTFLTNGQTPAENWTALFAPGERVRLRFINGSAMTHHDVRIPGLKMTVVAADGQNVQPVAVDQFRIAPAETYDVIVRPDAETAYTIFAGAMDRSGYARATLAPRAGMTAAIPPPSARPLLTMQDMGGMDDGMMDDGMMDDGMMDDGMMDDGMMDDGMMDHGMMDHGMMDHGMTGPPTKTMTTDPSAGQHRVLDYADLKALRPRPRPPPEREIVLNLTGNMERYFWSINGKKYSQAEPLRLAHNERVRVTFINRTMMNHPMHLHGHWMELRNGAGDWGPRKHTINVKPGQTLSFDLTADALGYWAFHCHLLYHMATGMFRDVIVDDSPSS